MLSEKNSADTKNIRSILSFIFPSIFGEWSASSHEDAVFNNRISTKESLLKLLHSGPTKFIYSSKEIKHFLASENDRREILIDAFDAGVLPGWLQYASEFTSKSDIVNPVSIINELIALSKTAHTENRQNLTDYIAPFVISILKSIEDYQFRKDLINHLSSNDTSMSTSEHILLRLLQKSRIWKSGIYNGLQEYEDHELRDFPINPADLIVAKDMWLDTLRRKANEQDIFTSEPEPISILFRWGQLNENDYAEVQEYINKMTENQKGLKAFIDCFYEGKGFEGIEKFFSSLDIIIEKINSLDEQPQFGPRMREYLEAVSERSKESPQV